MPDAPGAPDSEEGVGGALRARGGLGAGEAALWGVGRRSVATSLAIPLSAAREEDLPDLDLEAGLGGGMLVLWGVRKEEASGAGGGRSSSSPSNWGMVDILRSASREDALEDLGRDDGVVGRLWWTRAGVWRAPGRGPNREALLFVS